MVKRSSFLSWFLKGLLYFLLPYKSTSMKKFYELRMKSGRKFIVSTNEDGVCQFFINGNEYAIYTEGSGSNSFTFSVEKKLELEEEDLDIQLNQDLEVVSVHEVSIKRNPKNRRIFGDWDGLSLHNKNVKKDLLRWKENFYSAIKGGIETPGGYQNSITQIIL